MLTSVRRFTLIIAGVLSLQPRAHGCACGCNVFTVGARWTMPTASGFGAYLQYNYMDQSRNWGGWSSASPDANSDLEIRTHFYTLGARVMVDREWGIMAEAPVWNRYFKTTEDDGNIVSATHTSFGDVRLMGMYTGLSEDMSTGIQLGVKLPTGSFHGSLLDRDTQIGTGTTDFLLGGYRMGQGGNWGWYAQVMWQHAFNMRGGYRPGDSFDANVGLHYDGFLPQLPIVPVVQVEGSFRGIDSGENAEPDNTGYGRVYVAPGVQIVLSGRVSLYGDVRIPVITHVRGNQLVAPALMNLTIGFAV
jgi:hypothetical protein